MNLFILNNDPVIAAQEQCDKHVVKMIVESAQMLSTVHRMLDGVKEKRLSKSGKRISTPIWVTRVHFEEIFNSDSQLYGGSNTGSGGGIPATEHPAHDRPQSIQVDIPPLGVVFFKLRVV